MESDEIILATWGVCACAFGVSAAGISAVGIWEGVLRGSAQELQKWLPCGFCAEHFGHCTIDGGVIGIWRTLPIICDYLQEGKKVCRDLGEIAADILFRAMRDMGNLPCASDLPEARLWTACPFVGA
jgi:hypothetical protein